jgi:hypothetical protein
MASSIITPDYFIRLRRAVQSVLGLILKISTFVIIALFGGVLSSWYVINHGAAFNTERSGPWVKWTLGGRINADPYSLIRYNRQSQLAFSSTFVSRYEARFDSDNRRLHSACHYAIEGSPPASDWWSINVFNARGRLIPNPAKRYGFNAGTIIPNTDGSIRIDIAREARPGNWIPTTRAGRLVVVLEYQNRTGDAAVPDDADAVHPLPTIKRIDCR